MKNIRLIKNYIQMILLLTIGTLSYSGSPVLKFTRLSATTISVPSNNTGTAQYMVTNQSSRTHVLQMRSITGVSQNTSSGYCGNPFTLAYHQSCVLNLTINGSLIPSYFSGAPVLCEKGSSLQCYKPNTADVLTVTKTEPTYTVGGTVNGLLGTLVLENNGRETLTLTADGTFNFPTKEPTGASYSVTIQTQPATQTCTVSNGSGTISNANITNVTVVCSTNAYTVSGTATGLAGGESVVLQNNGGDNLRVSSNGSFTFATPVAQGATYIVTVLTQPNTQTCTVTNGNGTMGGTNVTNVSVTCSTNAYTVGGTLSGLASGESVVLQNNGGDNLTQSNNGGFAFATAVAQGAHYDVTVLTQPTTQTCSVTNGNGSMGGANVSNILVSCVTNTTALSTSVTSLALSKTGYTEYGVSRTPSSGVARTITITNTGQYPAMNLSISYPSWPSGTNASSNCGTSLAAGSFCTITITPGSTATSDGTNPCTAGTAPVAQTIAISADNASTVSSAAIILGYGCVYQGGYVYAFDDTTPDSSSVGGKVVTTSDQAQTYPNGIMWSSNGIDGNYNVSYDVIPLISETASAPTYNSAQSTYNNTYANSGTFPFPPSMNFVNCSGAIDGACNTNNILAFYNVYITNYGIGSLPYDVSSGTTNFNFYAAGLCKQSIGSYADWYLPAICEMGYGINACGTSDIPTIQNIQKSLIDISGFLNPSGQYWSSTEYADYAQFNAWFEVFAPNNSSNQYSDPKTIYLGVRCSRALTT